MATGAVGPEEYPLPPQAVYPAAARSRTRIARSFFIRTSFGMLRRATRAVRADAEYRVAPFALPWEQSGCRKRAPVEASSREKETNPWLAIGWAILRSRLTAEVRKE
jgi:hypothetical protein